MEKYFKLIELPDKQVMIERGWDSDKELDYISIIWHEDRCKLECKLSFYTEEERDKQFNEFDEERAIRICDKLSLTK